MYRHRELLTSLLASAMLTTTLLPSEGSAHLASVIDPSAAGRFMSSALSRMPDGGWALPEADSVVSAANTPAIIAVSVSNVQSPEPAITREKLKAIHDRALQNHTPATIGPSISVPLGLTQSETLVTKQLSDTDAAGKHIFAAPATPNGKILMILRNGPTANFYVCDMNGKLLSAGVYNLADKVFTLIPNEAAAAGFQAELRFFNSATIPPPDSGNA